MSSSHRVLSSSLAAAAVVALAGLVGLAPPGRADEAAYDLLGPAPKKGQVITVTSKSSLKDAKVSVDDGTMKNDLEMSTTNTAEKQLELLEVKGRKIQKAKVKVIKDQGTRTVMFGGMSKEDDEKSPLVGQTVLLERTKDGWKRTLADNADATEEQKKKLSSMELDSWEESLFPEKKVPVGHKWEVDASKLSRLFDAQFSGGTGKIKAHFVKMEKVGDQPCAVIELDLDVKGTSIMSGEKVKVEFKGPVTMHRSPSLGVNLKTKADLKIKFSGKNKTPGGGEIDLEVQGKLVGETSTTVK